MGESVQVLLERCRMAHEAGMGFPEVWHEILSGHPLVVTLPAQRFEHGEPALEVRLVTGHRLVCRLGGYVID